MDKFANVGNIFKNNNGKIYIIVYVNHELNRTLLLDPYSKVYIVAWMMDYEHHDWAQGHYFLKDFEGAVNYVLGNESLGKEVK